MRYRGRAGHLCHRRHPGSGRSGPARPRNAWASPRGRGPFRFAVARCSGRRPTRRRCSGWGGSRCSRGCPGCHARLDVRHDTTLEAVVRHALMVAPVGVLTSVAVYATLLAVTVRVLSLSLKPGFYKVDSRVGWSAWLVESMVDGARATLFPLYAGLITPFWLRRLGATIGKRVEASTVTGLPRLMRAADGSFLADDAQLAPYEAGGGWVLLGEASVGERSFVGNSGIVGPGRSVRTTPSSRSSPAPLPARRPDLRGWGGQRWSCLGSPSPAISPAPLPLPADWSSPAPWSSPCASFPGLSWPCSGSGAHRVRDHPHGLGLGGPRPSPGSSCSPQVWSPPW